MDEISLEANAVSKFISSLSKSIQALCHGCMDFNSSIEMIGYININIDSGNVVDCVLNEKVRKSTANSMTCVSNSFHAKKDKAKQTKDASCSPVRHSELAIQHSPNKRHSKEMPHRGLGRKRQKFLQRPNLPSYDYYSTTESPYHDQSSTSIAYQEQSTAGSTEYIDPEQQVKTEVMESLNVEFDPSPSTSSHEVSIKKEIEAPVPDSLRESHGAKPDMEDFGNDYNDPNTKGAANESTSQRNQSELFSEMDESSSQKDLRHFPLDDSNREDSFLSAPDDHDAASSHSQRFGNDNIEDNVDDSQFEVIEIGDDDEDVQGLFEQQPDYTLWQGHSTSQSEAFQMQFQQRSLLKREQNRRYRRKMREDPVFYEAFKAKERERVKQYRQRMKTVNEMVKNQLRAKIFREKEKSPAAPTQSSWKGASLQGYGERW